MTKKFHPHKRAISIETRKELRAHDIAWWQKHVKVRNAKARERMKAAK